MSPCRCHPASALGLLLILMTRWRGANRAHVRLDGHEARTLAQGKGGRRNKKRNGKRSTGPSRVVPHRSTTPARTCLTSLFGWEAVARLIWARSRQIFFSGPCRRQFYSTPALPSPFRRKKGRLFFSLGGPNNHPTPTSVRSFFALVVY